MTTPTASRALGAALLGAVAGCTTTLQPARSPFDLPDAAAGPNDPALGERIVQKLREREARITTLRIWGTMTLVNERRDRTTEMNGTMVVRRPDRYRVRLRGPLSLLVADLDFVGGRFRMRMPIFGHTIEGVLDDPRRDPARPWGVPVDALTRAFLWRLPGEVQTARHASFDLIALDGGAVRTEIVFDPSRDVVVGERTWHERLLTSSIVYADYRPLGGLLLPYRFDFAAPPERMHGRVVVRRYEINGTIPDAEFEPAP